MHKPKLIVYLVAVAALIFIGYLVERPKGATAPEDPGVRRYDTVGRDDTVGETTNIEAMTEKGMEIVEEDGLTYFEASKGFYAAPAAEGRYPGVVMIHEWWGLNDGIKDAARMLAAKGYMVLAVDLYDGKVAATPEEARAYTGAIVKEKAIDNMRVAAQFLRGRKASKIASWGWCFGGGQSMNLAISGEPLDATVIYYGNLETDPEKLKAIDWPVLGVFGDRDQSITPEKARAFDAALDKAGVANEVYIYPGVGHAFANPSGANYAPTETKDAWEKTLAFLQKHLR